MQRMLQQVPIQAAIMAPFASLPELSAHEQQLLGPHIDLKEPQIRELLPVMAWH